MGATQQAQELLAALEAGTIDPATAAQRWRDTYSALMDEIKQAQEMVQELQRTQSRFLRMVEPPQNPPNKSGRYVSLPNRR